MESSTELAVKILDKLGLFWDDIAFTSRFKVPTYYGDLIKSIIEEESLDISAVSLKTSLSTLERKLPLTLGKLFNKLPNSPWSFSLLLLIELKFCRTCNTIKDIKEFNVRKETRYRASCSECERKAVKDFNIKNPEARRNYYIKNREALLKYSKFYYSLNQSAQLEVKRSYALNHPWIDTYKAAKRRASKRNATVPWSQYEEIKQFYKSCPEGYHVDHIIPIQHDKVCGLHVIENLQHLTPADNLSKSNNFKTDWE